MLLIIQNQFIYGFIRRRQITLFTPQHFMLSTDIVFSELNWRKTAERHMNEAEAIRKLKKRDLQGLETLVLLYQSRAVRASYLITLDKQLAEEVAQIAFLRAFDYISRFDPSRPFGPWFYRIVVNESVKAVTQANQNQSLEDEAEGKPTTFLERLSTLGASVEEKVMEHELVDAIKQALQQVSVQDRKAIVLKYYLEYSEQEMAEEMAVETGTVKWRLHMARYRIRKILNTVGFR